MMPLEKNALFDSEMWTQEIKSRLFKLYVFTQATRTSLKAIL